MKIIFDYGSEGPSHDPYAFSEITIEKGKDKIIAHLGLTIWLKVNGERQRFNEVEEFEKVFEELVGFNTHKAQKYYDKIRYPKRCPKCNSKKKKYEEGYYGEVFIVCGECETIVAYDSPSLSSIK